jgi:hypothetical protein
MEGLIGFLSKIYQGFFIFFGMKNCNKKWLKAQPFHKLKSDDIVGQRFTI